MWQEGAYCQELQREADNEDNKKEEQGFGKDLE